MQIIRHTHACVEFVARGVHFIVDPGEFGIPESIESADAVLVTHDHFDHIDHKALVEAKEKNPKLAFFGPQAFADNAQFPVTVLRDGDHFEVGGVGVDVIGSWQAITSLFDPPIENVGYLVAKTAMHPGDAYPAVPGIYAIFLPLAAPWSKNVDVENYLNLYRPKHVLPYHDLNLNEMGSDFGQKSMARAAERVGATFHPMMPGDVVELEDVE